MSEQAGFSGEAGVVQSGVVEVCEPSAKYLAPSHLDSNWAISPPLDWDVKPLGKLAELVPSGSRGWASYYAEQGATFIRSQNVLKGQLDFSDHQCVVAPVGSEGSRTRVELGDLLITITGNSVGNVAYVDRPLGETYISQHVGLVRLKDPASAAYVCRFLSPGAPGNAQIASSQSGQSKPGLNLTNLRDFVVAVPPEEEQRKIATALSDVDALIAGLERLIAKKRDIKQAAMQQLLAGQTRLPGFTGEWEVKTLGDVVEKMVGGGTPSRSNPAYWGNEIPWVTVKDFATFHPRQAQESITKIGLNNSASNLIPAGTLITSTRMALGKAVVYDVDVAINQDLKALFVRSSSSVDFLHYWFEHNAAKIDDLGSGSTVKGISLTELKRLPFPVMALPEQTAIATVLSDMDADLTALESRLAKTRAIKQGMMQELLTGRIRLV